MKIAAVVLVILIGLFITFLFVSGSNSKNGHAPGVVDLSLTPCSETPNCVCSEFEEAIDHYIKPFVIEKKPDNDILLLVKTIIKEMNGITLVHTDDYLAATFSSRIFGFVDDVEVRADRVNNLLHIRSASRVGYSDAGVNRKRAELLKTKLAESLAK